MNATHVRTSGIVIVRAMTLPLGRPEQGALVGWGLWHGRYVVEGVGPRGPHAVVGEGQSCGCWGF